jgi:hypothetical protein
MKVELLYFDGCPSWLDALENLRAAVPGDLQIRLVRIETLEQAVAERFTGSPTIRVDGRDLFPASNGDFGLACRVYATPAGLNGAPTADMVRAALHGRRVGQSTQSRQTTSQNASYIHSGRGRYPPHYGMTDQTQTMGAAVDAQLPREIQSPKDC